MNTSKREILGRKAKTWAAVVGLLGVILFVLTDKAMTATYLETNRSCSGARLSQAERLEIVGWDGDSREALDRRVYDFRVRCDDGERDVIDLFLAAERSDRYRREGSTLLWRARTERRSVKTREAGCEQVPKQVRTYPSDAEARAACRGIATPMACELEYQGQDRWVTEMVERCWRARYETRQVPVWKRFPVGYAPLPRGARIVDVSPKSVAVGPKSVPAPRTAVTHAERQGGGGSSFWTFLVFGLLGGAGLYYFHRRQQADLREQVAAARSEMGGGQEGYGMNFGSGGFKSSRSSGDAHGSGYGERERQHRDPGRGDRTHHASDGGGTGSAGLGDAMPETVEEACAILNVTPDTPPEAVNAIYKAMAKVWHADAASGSIDQARCDAKMKQLNAAREFVLGKRT